MKAVKIKNDIVESKDEMGKLKIDEILVVEGRDDTAAINRAVDAVTIETHGFGMNPDMWMKIEKAYKTKGIIVFTDPDYAGEQIRRKILEKYPAAKQAFLPQKLATKKDNIGIENAKPKDIIEALNHAKCTANNENKIFSEEDLIKYDLMGCEDSKARREALGGALGIGYGNTKAFLKKLNSFGISKEEFTRKVEEL